MDFVGLLPYVFTAVAVLGAALVLFAGNQVYRAVTLKKAPDYDVESYFWIPDKEKAGVASKAGRNGKKIEGLGEFPSIFEEATVTVSVIVPAYNEEERIVPMMKEMLAYLEKREKDSAKDKQRFTWEIIVVDDGSKDKTSTFVNKTYVEKYGTEKFRVLRLFRNNGKGGAVRKGAVRARGQYILMADADGATQASDLGTLMTQLQRIEASPEGAPKGSNIGPLGIAIGSRAHLEQAADEANGGAVARRSPLRKFLMWGFHTFIELMIGNSEIKDTQCGFKLFTRETARLLFPVQHIDRWAFDVELLFLAARHKVPMVEVPVTWNEIEGSKLDVLSSTIQMARDIFAIRACYSSGLWSAKHTESTPHATSKNPVEHVTPVA